MSRLFDVEVRRTQTLRFAAVAGVSPEDAAATVENWIEDGETGDIVDTELEYVESLPSPVEDDELAEAA